MAKLESEKRNHDESIKNIQCEMEQMQQENAAVLNAKERVTFLFLRYRLQNFMNDEIFLEFHC